MTYEQAKEKAYTIRSWSEGYIVEKDGEYEIAHNAEDLECAKENGWKFVGINKEEEKEEQRKKENEMAELKENQFYEVEAFKLSKDDGMHYDWIKFFRDYDEAIEYANKLHKDLKHYGWNVEIIIADLNEDAEDNYDNEFVDRVLEIRADQ